AVAAHAQPRQEEPHGIAGGEQCDDDPLPARMNAHELARREPVEAAEKDDDEREDDDDAHRERDMLTCRQWRSSTFRSTFRMRDGWRTGSSSSSIASPRLVAARRTRPSPRPRK